MRREEKSLNWVDRRAIREGNLDVGAPKVWDQVQRALQDACDSFNEHYPQANRENAADCKLESGHGRRVRRIISADLKAYHHAQELEVLVTFDEAPPSINATFAEGVLTFRIEADEESAFATLANKRMTPDEISEKILERVLFPIKERTPPKSRTPRGSETGWMG